MDQIFASSSENLSKALINRRKMELNKLSNKITILEHDERKSCATNDRHKFAFIQGHRAKRRDWWRSDLNHRHYLEKEFNQVVEKRRRENEMRRQFYKKHSQVLGLYFPSDNKPVNEEPDSDDENFFGLLGLSQSLVNFKSEPNLLQSIPSSPTRNVKPNAQETQELTKQVVEIQLERMPSMHLTKNVLIPVRNSPNGEQQADQLVSEIDKTQPKDEKPAVELEPLKLPKIVAKSTPRRNGDSWPFNTAEDIDKFHKTYNRFLKNTPCFIETRESIKQEQARKSFLEKHKQIEKSRTQKRDDRYYNLLGELKLEKASN